MLQGVVRYVLSCLPFCGRRPKPGMTLALLAGTVVILLGRSALASPGPGCATATDLSPADAAALRAPIGAQCGLYLCGASPD